MLPAGWMLTRIEVGLELHRREKSWFSRLLKHSNRPAGLVGLALAITERGTAPRDGLEMVLGLYRRLPDESPARGELLGPLQRLGAPAEVWLELFRGAGTAARPTLLDALLDAPDLSAAPAHDLVDLVLDPAPDSPAFARALETLRRAGRTDVLEVAYKSASPAAQEVLFRHLHESPTTSARFYESLFLDASETPARRKAGATYLLHGTGERGVRQLLERAEPPHAAQLRRTLLVFGLAADTPEPDAKGLLRVIEPLSEEELAVALAADAGSVERRLALLRQAAAGPQGLALLGRFLAAGTAREAVIAVARERVERKLLHDESPPLQKPETRLLQELGRMDLDWFRDLIRRCPLPSVLSEAVTEIAWRIPLGSNPIGLLTSYYKQPGVGDHERRRVLKALLRHRAGVDVYIDLYAASAPGLRQRIAPSHGQPSQRQRLLQILEEHPRVLEIPRDWLIATLLAEMGDKSSRASLLHILERRGDANLLEDADQSASARQRQAFFDLLFERPSTRLEFAERVLLDPKEDPKRRLQSALRLANALGRGGLSELLEHRDPAHGQDVRRWLLERYLNRATPTADAASLLRALLPARPNDLESVLPAAGRAFEGRLLDLGRAALAQGGAADLLLKLLREGDEVVRPLAGTLALEHLKRRADRASEGGLDAVDLDLADELNKLYPPAEPAAATAEPAAATAEPAAQPQPGGTGPQAHPETNAAPPVDGGGAATRGESLAEPALVENLREENADDNLREENADEISVLPDSAEDSEDTVPAAIAQGRAPLDRSAELDLPEVATEPAAVEGAAERLRSQSLREPGSAEDSAELAAAEDPAETAQVDRDAEISSDASLAAVAETPTTEPGPDAFASRRRADGGAASETPAAEEPAQTAAEGSGQGGDALAQGGERALASRGAAEQGGASGTEPGARASEPLPEATDEADKAAPPRADAPADAELPAVRGLPDTAAAGGRREPAAVAEAPAEPEAHEDASEVEKRDLPGGAQGTVPEQSASALAAPVPLPAPGAGNGTFPRLTGARGLLLAAPHAPETSGAQETVAGAAPSEPPVSLEVPEAHSDAGEAAHLGSADREGAGGGETTEPLSSAAPEGAEPTVAANPAELSLPAQSPVRPTLVRIRRAPPERKGPRLAVKRDSRQSRPAPKHSATGPQEAEADRSTGLDLGTHGRGASALAGTRGAVLGSRPVATSRACSPGCACFRHPPPSAGARSSVFWPILPIFGLTMRARMRCACATTPGACWPSWDSRWKRCR